MEEYIINGKTSYSVFVGSDLLHSVGMQLKQTFAPRKICVITDSKVNALYAQVVTSSLMEHGFQISKIVFPGGEHTKNISTYSNIMSALAANNISRYDMVLGLGGGVVCDLAGFVAATYMGGIPYMMIPTTLSSQLTSSIGGNYAINISDGKDLISTYHDPEMVICDLKLLRSLPEECLNDGITESVRIAAISDQSILSHLNPLAIDYIMERSLSIQKSLVEADPNDNGVRNLLYFGNTVGYALEKISNYNMRHSQAIALGMLCESHGAFRLGLTDCDLSIKISSVLQDIPTPAFSKNEDLIFKLSLLDKKIRDGAISVIVPKSFGQCFLKKISLSDLKKLISLGLEILL